MSSPIADALRRAQRERDADQTPDERLRLALALGQEDLRRYAEANGLTASEARELLRRAAQRGRVPSAVMEEG